MVAMLVELSGTLDEEGLCAACQQHLLQVNCLQCPSSNAHTPMTSACETLCVRTCAVEQALKLHRWRILPSFQLLTATLPCGLWRECCAWPCCPTHAAD